MPDATATPQRPAVARPGARPEPHPGRALGHADPGRPRRRRDQGRAPGRRRRHAQLGPALPRRRGRQATRRTPATTWPSTAASARSPSTSTSPRARRSSAAWPRAPTSCSRTSRPARWRATGSTRPRSAQVNPRLIYCSVTGFGQTGPRRDQPAYDFLIQAMGGLMSVTGERDDRPGGGPQKVGVPIVDLMTGMYAAVAVLAALARRNETGQGDTIDIAMLDVQVGLPGEPGDELPGRRQGAAAQRQRAPQHPAAGRLRLRRRRSCSAVGNDGQFAKLCEVFGRPEWAQDERFADQRPARAQHRRAVGAAARAVRANGKRAS